MKKAVDSEAASVEARSQSKTKPGNLRANVVPVEGYVLSVDGKLKARYGTASEAAAEAAKLKQSFPVIQVSVYDAAQRTYTPVDAPAEPQEK